MRGPRPDYGQSDWASQAECDGGKVTDISPEISPQFHLNHLSLEPAEPPYCPPEEECNAEMRNQDCTCDCNEEPPPKCDLDVVVMIDVCSCSPEVWHGIKSYVDALVTKYDQEIGVRTVIKAFLFFGLAD